MNTNKELKTKHVGSVRSYIIGFVLSLILTITSYSVYLLYAGKGIGIPLEIAIALLMSLAVFQLFIQLIFFLHIGPDNSSHWKLGIFISTVSIILMIVLASIWIMNNLNYNMMPDMDYFMIEEGVKK